MLGAGSNVSLIVWVGVGVVLRVLHLGNLVRRLGNLVRLVHLVRLVRLVRLVQVVRLVLHTNLE
jgi:hypothetical protein